MRARVTLLVAATMSVVLIAFLVPMVCSWAGSRPPTRSTRPRPRRCRWSHRCRAATPRHPGHVRVADPGGLPGQRVPAQWRRGATRPPMRGVRAAKPTDDEGPAHRRRRGHLPAGVRQPGRHRPPDGRTAGQAPARRLGRPPRTPWPGCRALPAVAGRCRSACPVDDPAGDRPGARPRNGSAPATWTRESGRRDRPRCKKSGRISTGWQPGSVSCSAVEREAVADISHRLRTPVTALRLDSEALEDPDERARLMSDVDELDRTVGAIISDARRPVREDAVASATPPPW